MNSVAGPSDVVNCRLMPDPTSPTPRDTEARLEVIANILDQYYLRAITATEAGARIKVLAERLPDRLVTS